MSFAAPAAASPGGAAAAPAEEPEEAAPAAQEKTLFTLKLQSFDTAAKSKVIKEVKSMLGLSLIDSKKFVERYENIPLNETLPWEGTNYVL